MGIRDSIYFNGLVVGGGISGESLINKYNLENAGTRQMMNLLVSRYIEVYE